MKKVEEFMLKKGMRDLEIIKELHGKVSGETRQEVYTFMKHKQFRDTAQFEVLLSDDEYAILLKRLEGESGELRIREYYLAGINDEQYYFVHPLLGFEEQFLSSGRFPKMQEILDWVNKLDQGYIQRLQGDVLYQFVPLSNQNLPLLPSYMTIDDINREMAYRRVNLGRHVLTTDAFIHIGKQCVLAYGSKVVLQHPDHGVKDLDVPRGHATLLAPQRGREFKVEGQNQGQQIRVAGFD